MESRVELRRKVGKSLIAVGRALTFWQEGGSYRYEGGIVSPEWTAGGFVEGKRRISGRVGSESR